MRELGLPMGWGSRRQATFNFHDSVFSNNCRFSLTYRFMLEGSRMTHDDDCCDVDFDMNQDLESGLINLTEFPQQSLPSSALRARVTPLDELGRPAAPWTVVVVEIDERTIAFNHLVPLTARHVIVTFEKRGMSTHSVKVELTWCRFDQRHRYTSGGRFILPLGRTA